MSSIVSDQNIINCLLCDGAFIHPGPRYCRHLLNEHGVIYNIDFLIEASIHRKTFSKLPSFIVPSKSLLVSDKSSQLDNHSPANASSSAPIEPSGYINVDGNNTVDNSLFGQVEDVIYDGIQVDTKDHETNANNAESESGKSVVSEVHCYFNCGETFKRVCDLDIHLKLKHNDVLPEELAKAEEAAKFDIALASRLSSIHRCALCGKIVTGESAFKVHILKHKVSLEGYKACHGSSEVKSATFQCGLCDKILKHEASTIHKHLQIVHGITWSQYLKRIREELQGIQQKPLQEVKLEECRVCGVKVKYLKDHMKHKHNDVKSDKCQICDKSFKYLSTHVKRVHGITWIKYLSRNQGKISKSIEEDPVAEIKLKECTICGVRVKYLNDHMRNQHKPGGKEKCQICDKRYKRLSTHFKLCHGFTKNEFSNAQAEGKVQQSANVSSKLVENSDSKDKLSTVFSKNQLIKPPKGEISDKNVKHCSVCEFEFDTRQLYLKHCQVIHNVKFKSKSQEKLSIVHPPALKHINDREVNGNFDCLEA